ncbi:translocon-associated protein subunit delta [Agrilus planipennis]|uniref:Translocon-associated protein subunit delta n=1 Tax=Agrilus planipennis TaxID=224129 RepID=A0A1W4X2V0_AGRPL|nr:translocon-associated protein subunit delta [Agrilus planipennis]
MIGYARIGVIFSVLIAAVNCDSCVRPEVSLKPFTTEDATVVTNIAYIAEFDLKCESGSVNNLYADIEGRIGPISKVGPTSYQVSWVEEVKSAKTGDRVIRLFDEEGYVALRKAIRSGQDITSVEPLVYVVLNHPGAFTGPWFRSESVAVVVGFIIAYIAVSSRSKLSS